MNDHQHKLRLSLYTTFVLAALVILFDFILPGRVVNDEIIDVKRERQQYFNAARNYHYSYKVITSEHQFSVAENFAQLVQDHEKIEYSVSRIFKEVNWYRLLSSENNSFYSLRILSGLVLPLLTIISILVAYLYKKNIGILVFVLQVLLVADLIFLMT
ncbi:hypothetical protein [Fulvivirga sedimenti]|uniref:Uncharacterized protein n=1 Tax=Fulvivirga sedimenti TaxID=2879465 RepID=A0A9X1L0S4_9BACT|nr:hypothetical protein [Fulvivirga sedimenti]MCA6074994.1 hypothetical protein [Fulvivirga sedimenti]MCA6076171.1 hypothetical protein [Fulvivirga sedimenti]MCA6077299.1 hypothetical protein [Fulvivirga sedimenti]